MFAYTVKKSFSVSNRKKVQAISSGKKNN